MKESDIIAAVCSPENWTDETLLLKARKMIRENEDFSETLVSALLDHNLDAVYLGKLIDKAEAAEGNNASVFEDLSKSKNGLPLNKRFNYDKILENDNFLHGKFSYNLLDGIVYVSGFPWNKQQHAINKIDECKMQGYISANYGLHDIDLIEAAYLSAAFDNSFNPLQDILNRIRGTWDGKSRLKELFPKYLGAENNNYTFSVTKLLFHGAIQRALTPGCKFDYCIVIQGKQGTGKSTLLQFLALQDEFFTDDLKDLGSDKAFELFRGKWIVELGEMLFTKRTKEIESIKSFLSRRSDRFRTPYEKHAADFPRCCIFIGTTNNDDFLPDDKTGNRRFVPLICSNKPKKHPLEDEEETRAYIMQCYAEALQEGENNGYNLVLPEEQAEQAAELNAAHVPDDPRVGMIQKWLDETTENFVCSMMIWDNVFESERRQPFKYELSDINAIMNNSVTGWKKFGSENTRYYFKKYGKQRAWKRIINTQDIHKTYTT